MEFKLDLDRLMKSIAPKGGGNNHQFKPVTGKNVIRMLPLVNDPGMPIVPVYTRYLNGKTYFSLRTFNQTDPIDEYCKKLWNTGNEEDKELARKLSSKMSHMALIVDRSQGDHARPKWWQFSPTVNNTIVKAMVGDETLDIAGKGNITHPKTGRDITVLKMTPQQAGNQYGKIDVHVRESVSVLTNDTNVLKDWLNNQPSIEDVFVRADYATLEQELLRFLNPLVNEQDNKQTKVVNYGTTGSTSNKIDELDSFLEDDNDVPFGSDTIEVDPLASLTEQLDDLEL